MKIEKKFRERLKMDNFLDVNKIGNSGFNPLPPFMTKSPNVSVFKASLSKSIDKKLLENR